MNDLHTFVTSDGYKLAYNSAGRLDAPPLVMLHGWFSHRGVWQQTVEMFQDRYYCVAVDLLGFGDSVKPPKADYGIEAQGQRILALADALGLDQFTLMGHSMGGQISLCIASLRAPQRTAKLVSVSGVVAARLTPYVETVVYKLVAVGMALRSFALARWLSSYQGYANWHFATWFYKIQAMPFEAWELDRRMALQAGGEVATYKAGQAIHNLDLTPHLAKITAPTLAIFGQQDAVVPLSDGHLIEQHVPDGKLVLIDQCGHFPMYEQTSQYLKTLQTFL